MTGSRPIGPVAPARHQRVLRNRSHFDHERFEDRVRASGRASPLTLAARSGGAATERPACAQVRSFGESRRAGPTRATAGGRPHRRVPRAGRCAGPGRARLRPGDRQPGRTCSPILTAGSRSSSSSSSSLRLLAAVGLWFGWRRGWVLTMLLVGHQPHRGPRGCTGTASRSTCAWRSTSCWPSTSTRVPSGTSSSRPTVGRSQARGHLDTAARRIRDVEPARPTSRSCAPTSRSSATTRGELFYPTAVEGYLAECDLLVGTSEDDARVLVPHGEVTAASLGDVHAAAGREPVPALVQQPLGSVELARWRLRPERVRFSAPGRLARVGLFARLIDAGFTASLLLRGSVPGGTAAAAQIKYEAMRAADPRYVYHGRVVREHGWICLHYLFFYFMNDYRSTFYGVNDHEADWEQVFIYLEDAPDGPRRSGSRRPRTTTPATSCGAAGTIRRSRRSATTWSSTRAPARMPRTSSAASTSPRCPSRRSEGSAASSTSLREFWRDTLRQPDPGDLRAALSSALSVPFVDYARGDGLVVGPGEAATWTPRARSTTTSTGWTATAASSASTPTTGSPASARRRARSTRAPGTVRQSWNDPLGFAGLDKSAPPWRAPEVIGERIAGLEEEATEVDAEVDRLAARAARPRARGPGARGLGVDGGAPRGSLRGPRARGGRPRGTAVASGEHRGHDRGAPGRARGDRGGRARRPARAPAAPASAGPGRGDPLQRRRRALVRGERRAAAAGDRGARRARSS